MAIVHDRGAASLRDIARELDVPLSTARRQAATFLKHGLLFRTRPGHHVAGAALIGLPVAADVRPILALAARPVLRSLSRTHRLAAHLGVLEGDMVTYLVKQEASGVPLFTRESGQLEAYCSGVGKILLAALGETAREAYLDAGPFVPLTAATITDPAVLRLELAVIATRGHAVDAGEIADDLWCVAVPVAGAGIAAALSVSGHRDRIGELSVQRLVADLSAAATAISTRLGAAAPCR